MQTLPRHRKQADPVKILLSLCQHAEMKTETAASVLLNALGVWKGF